MKLHPAELLFLARTIRDHALAWLFIAPTTPCSESESRLCVQRVKGPFTVAYTFPPQNSTGFEPNQLDIWHASPRRKLVFSIRWLGQELKVDRLDVGDWIQPLVSRHLLAPVSPEQLHFINTTTGRGRKSVRLEPKTLSKETGVDDMRRRE